MTHREVIANIKQICNLTFDMDAEQVLDIILGREERRENKTAAYEEIVSKWQASDWKSVLREFYVSFQKAKLCEIFLDEQDHNMRTDVIVDAQKDVTPYKKAPDSYYLHLANLELTPPQDVAPTGDESLILVSLYAAIASGENYGTVAYPPQRFIDEVLGQQITPSEYLATLMKLSEEDTPLQTLAHQAVENNKEAYKQMRAAYKKLTGKDVKATTAKVAGAAAMTAATATVVAGKAGRKVKKAMYTPEEPAKATKPTKALIDSDVIKSFGKWGIKMLIINGVATPSKLVLGFSGISAMMGEKGLAGLLDAIGNVGFCFIPAIGLVCTVLMMFTGIVSNTEKGQTRAKLIMVLAMCCTAYSAYSLIKIGIAMIVSAVQRTFTLENIGSFVITSPFKLIGGAFNGIKSLFGG